MDDPGFIKSHFLGRDGFIWWIGQVVDENDAKINDWHERHSDEHLEVYCDNHPDSLECRVYDD